MSRNVLLGLTLCVLGSICSWLQINGQFIWEGLRKYNIPIAIIGGSIISCFFIYGFKMIVEGYNGQVWPARLITGALGTLIYVIMTWAFLRQGLDMKTITCIILSISILLIQIYWK